MTSLKADHFESRQPKLADVEVEKWVARCEAKSCAPLNPAGLCCDLQSLCPWHCFLIAVAASWDPSWNGAVGLTWQLFAAIRCP